MCMHFNIRKNMMMNSQAWVETVEVKNKRMHARHSVQGEYFPASQLDGW